VVVWGSSGGRRRRRQARAHRRRKPHRGSSSSSSLKRDRPIPLFNPARWLFFLKQNRQISFKWDLTVITFQLYRVPFFTRRIWLFFGWPSFLARTWTWVWAWALRFTIHTPSFLLSFFIYTPQNDLNVFFSLFAKALKWLLNLFKFSKSLFMLT
jgi:hypothetical protein